MPVSMYSALDSGLNHRGVVTRISVRQARMHAQCHVFVVEHISRDPADNQRF